MTRARRTAIVAVVAILAGAAASAQEITPAFRPLKGKVAEVTASARVNEDDCANGRPPGSGDVFVDELSTGVDQITGLFSLPVPAPWWEPGRLVVVTYPGFSVVSPRVTIGGQFFLPRTTSDFRINICVYNPRAASGERDEDSDLLQNLVAEEFLLTPWSSADPDWGCSVSDALADDVGGKVSRPREQVKRSVEAWLLGRASEGIARRYLTGDRCRDRRVILRRELGALVELVTQGPAGTVHERLAPAFYNFGLLTAGLGKGYLVVAKEAFELVLRSVRPDTHPHLTALAAAEHARVAALLQ